MGSENRGPVRRCPSCGDRLDQGYVYVRGMGAAMYWSEDGDLRFGSTQGLVQLDLQHTVGGRNQATLPALRCHGCGFVGFTVATVL